MNSKTIRRMRALLDAASPYNNYPFSWDVKITFHPSVEQTLQKIADSFYINRTELFTTFPHADSVVETFLKGDDLFNRVTESMWESWKDADTYSMCDPERLKSWGLPYGMKAPGVAGPFKVKYGLYGRSSGHLVVEEFDGITLNGFVEESLDYYSDTPTWLARLGAMVEEWNYILTPQNVYEEYKYTIAWMVNIELEDSVSKVA